MGVGPYHGTPRERWPWVDEVNCDELLLEDRIKTGVKTDLLRRNGTKEIGGEVSKKAS